jgi:hypothetical protein
VNGDSLPTELLLLQLSSLKPLCKDPAENTVSDSTSVVARVSVAAGTFLPSRCLVTALHATIFR